MTMRVGVPAETAPGERRVAIVPQGAEKLVDAGIEVAVEAGAGIASGYSDSSYRDAGAQIVERPAAFACDLVARVRPSTVEEVGLLREGAILVSLLDPFFEPDLLASLARRRVTSLCLELIPRSTRAQRMDVLSSQANLAGYVTVILAAEQLDRVFPMMMTPAGTLPPARVFVIGAGVAGLQA